MTKYDCFGLRNGKCNVLTSTICFFTDCSFYKTQQEHERQMLESRERAKRKGYYKTKDYRPKVDMEVIFN